MNPNWRSQFKWSDGTFFLFFLLLWCAFPKRKKKIFIVPWKHITSIRWTSVQCTNKTVTAGDTFRCCTWFRRSAPSPSAAPVGSASKTETRAAVRFCWAAVWRQHVPTARLPCLPWSRHLLLAAPLPGDGSNTWSNVNNKPGFMNLQSYCGHIFCTCFVFLLCSNKNVIHHPKYSFQ